MNTQYVEIDISELRQFSDKLRKLADGEVKEELLRFLDATGFEMLKVIEDEIIRLKVVDTGLLLDSFHKGSENNVYELNEGDLSLEIGTNVEYAGWVNDGHSQTPGRFIPGTWNGDGKFQYDPSADTGMVLKASRVDGKHYLEHAVTTMEKKFPQALERFIDNWLKSYFS